MRKWPIPVLVVAILYLAVGVIGFIFHFSDLYAQGRFSPEGLLPEVTELVALAVGVYLLRRENWARWVAVIWMAGHVVLSAVEQYRGFVVHSILCALIAWALFYPGAGRYFAGRRATPSAG